MRNIILILLFSVTQAPTPRPLARLPTFFISRCQICGGVQKLPIAYSSLSLFFFCWRVTFFPFFYFSISQGWKNWRHQSDFESTHFRKELDSAEDPFLLHCRGWRAPREEWHDLRKPGHRFWAEFDLGKRCRARFGEDSAAVASEVRFVAIHRHAPHGV